MVFERDVNSSEREYSLDEILSISIKNVFECYPTMIVYAISNIWIGGNTAARQYNGNDELDNGASVSFMIAITQVDSTMYKFIFWSPSDSFTDATKIFDNILLSVVFLKMWIAQKAD